MNLESQVTSLEMSKKLALAGFVAETCFWWEDSIALRQEATGTFISYQGSPYKIVCYPKGVPSHLKRHGDLWVPAYTFQQLWEALIETGYEILYHQSGDKSYLHIDLESFGDTWVDAAAKAVLWCIEGGHLEPSDVTKS